MPGTTLVVSPLIALMKDQVDKLNRKYQIPSVSLNYELKTGRPEVYRRTLQEAVKGKFKLIFLAPERFDRRETAHLLKHLSISFAVIDEAHCISLWGHDFRPHYRKVFEFLRSVGETPILAVTATAPPAVQKDLVGTLGEGAKLIRAPSKRGNLRLHVIRVFNESEKYASLENIISKLDKPGIVYVGTHSECERVTAFLNHAGIKAIAYHGGIGQGRNKIQDAFMNDRWPVIVATCAFGMGIDKDNIRFIIHFRFPGSPEVYYQEIGRAGRDGRKADCILLFDPGDIELQEHFLQQGYPSKKQFSGVWETLSPKISKTARDLALQADLTLSQVQNMIIHLLERKLVWEERGDTETRYKRRRMALSSFELREFDKVRRWRLNALGKMLAYSETDECLMAFLCNYLGDHETENCGCCSNCKNYQYGSYKEITPGVRTFEEEWHPMLKPSLPFHKGGICLDYYKNGEVGNAVAKDKYSPRRTYRDSLAFYAASVIEKDYPIAEIDFLCSIPGSAPVDKMAKVARALADRLGLPCKKVLERIGQPRAQKSIRTKADKRNNVKNTFSVGDPRTIRGRTILLVDDIYDSGWTFRECARVLCQAGAKEVHIFALVRTQHVDNL